MYTIKGETDPRPRVDAWDKRWDLVLWEDLEGAGGEGGGRGARDGEDMWTQLDLSQKISLLKRRGWEKCCNLTVLILSEGFGFVHLYLLLSAQLTLNFGPNLQVSAQ